MLKKSNGPAATVGLGHKKIQYASPTPVQRAYIYAAESAVPVVCIIVKRTTPDV